MLPALLAAAALALCPAAAQAHTGSIQARCKDKDNVSLAYSWASFPSDHNTASTSYDVSGGVSHHETVGFVGSTGSKTFVVPFPAGTHRLDAETHWTADGGGHVNKSFTLKCKDVPPTPTPTPAPQPAPTQQQQQTVIVNNSTTVVMQAPQPAPAKPSPGSHRKHARLMIHTHHGHLVKVKVWCGGRLVFVRRHMNRNDVTLRIRLRPGRVTRVTVSIWTSTGKHIVVVRDIERTERGLVVIDP
jgi:hypothetical protein